MEYTEPAMKVLAKGVAARLHMDPKQFKARYGLSTYALAPRGIRDESATLQVMWTDGKDFRGVNIRMSKCDNWTLAQTADEIAAMFPADLAFRSIP